MEAKELMVGDLLHLKERTISGEHKSLVRVLSIQNKLEVMFLNGQGIAIADYSSFEPIPLTTAILEKNGFRRMNLKDGAFEHVFADDYFDISVDEWSDSIWRVRYDCTEMQTPHEQITCSYVHELQHFLKKRTSEELSENFKA